MTKEENAKIVKEFLDGDEWKYDISKEDERIVFYGGIGGLKGPYSSVRFLLAVADDDVQSFIIYPASAKNKLAEMAEFFARVNYTLRFGAFEMDYSDGEIRYHLAYPAKVIHGEDGKEFVARLLALPAKMVDRYSRGVVGILGGFLEPVKAVETCEKDI